MQLLQHFLTVLMFSAQLALTSLLKERSQSYKVGDRECYMCPAGQYQKSCTECVPCPSGSYTTELNREDSCHHCYRDCRQEFHKKVIKNCTSTSDLKCVCEDGFHCSENVSFTDNCRYCVKTQAAHSAVGTQAPSSTSSGRSSTSAGPFQFLKTVPQPSIPASNETLFLKETAGRSSHHVAAIVFPVIAIGCIALVILFCMYHPSNEACFKQAITKLCNKGDASQKTTESSQDRRCSIKPLPFSLPTANLGPVHVHNPGTVIFSFFSQPSGQVDSMTEGTKMTERLSSDEDDRGRPMFHPTPSPSAHLSEEERSGDAENIFFPSQEQGKDYHMSKEEVLLPNINIPEGLC
ncbi:uncharacterized protein ACBR49_005700 [Aulostomus maculatus]